MKKEDYMLRAINLAKKAKFHTNPNPRVGCVIVKNNKVIGEGFHKKYGGAHAEVNAINNCIDIINTYKPGFIEKRLYDTIDQDTLNYLHHIFEVYHGMLNEPH